jgi:RimJ/RimL family protein N-acetyltransferase
VLRGERVVLRAVTREDVPALAEWELEHDTWPEINLGPYTPRTVADVLQEYDAGGDSPYRSSEKKAVFAVAAEEGLVGSVSLWGIDAHNRRAHLGLGLGPEHRGKGYGSDACRVVLRHAFVDRGLHRVQLETLASNEAALRAYRAAGFVEEGRTRESGWVRGGFADEVIMSVLAHEWRDAGA